MLMSTYVILIIIKGIALFQPLGFVKFYKKILVGCDGMYFV